MKHVPEADDVGVKCGVVAEKDGDRAWWALGSSHVSRLHERLNILGRILLVEAAVFAGCGKIGGDGGKFVVMIAVTNHSETSPMSRIKQAI